MRWRWKIRLSNFLHWLFFCCCREKKGNKFFFCELSSCWMLSANDIDWHAAVSCHLRERENKNKENEEGIFGNLRIRGWQIREKFEYLFIFWFFYKNFEFLLFFLKIFDFFWIFIKNLTKIQILFKKIKKIQIFLTFSKNYSNFLKFSNKKFT